ncbi:helix-turn-helix domain-containing protein [Frankia sp. B2]|nr:helix-turn-helix domain-containing protein [Frankia sp. B2]
MCPNQEEIVRLAGVSLPTVNLWISRYGSEGSAGLLDRSRAAPREQIPANIRSRVLALTRSTPPVETGLRHWSSRQMAEVRHPHHRSLGLLALRRHREANPRLCPPWHHQPARGPRCGHGQGFR